MRSSRRQSNMTSSPPPSWPAAFVDKINNEFDNNRSENHSISKSFIDEGDSIPRLRAFAISDPYSNLLEKDTMTDGTSFGQNFPFQPTIPTEIRRNEFTSYRPTGWYQIPNEDEIETRDQACESPSHDPVLTRRSKSLPSRPPSPPSSPPPSLRSSAQHINHRLPNLMRHAINNTGENRSPSQQKHPTNQLLSTLGTKTSPLSLPKERINSRGNVRTDLESQSSQPVTNIQPSAIKEGKAKRNRSSVRIPETNQEMEFNTLSSATRRSLSFPHETMSNKNDVADFEKISYRFIKPATYMPQELQTNNQINNGKISTLHQQYDSTHEISFHLHNQANAFSVSRTDFESQSSQPATDIQPSEGEEGKGQRNRSSVRIPKTRYETILNFSKTRENQSFYQTGSRDPSVQQTIPKSTLFQNNPSHFHNTHTKVNSSDPYVIRKPTAILHEVQTYNEKKSIPSQQKYSTNQIFLRLPIEEISIRVPKEEINSSAESSDQLENQNNQPATNNQPSEAKEVKAPSNRYLAGISEFKVNRKSILTSKMGQDVSMKLPDGVGLEVLNGKCSLLNISKCDSASLTIRWGVASTQEKLPNEVFKLVANYVTERLTVVMHSANLLPLLIVRTKKDEIIFKSDDSDCLLITLPESIQLLTSMGN